jgi:chromosome segregation ATPase
MAQSLEKRMTDIEYIIAHLPDDLNARFAGVDVKIATIRETQLLHTQRFSTLERKIDALEVRMDGLESGMERLESRFERLESRFDGLEAKFDHLGTKVDLILARLRAP